MKNITVKQAKYIDKNKIINFLEENHVFKTSRKNWNNLFENNWSDLDNYGFILEHENQIVGYFGLIFSRNKIIKNHFTANINSWVVKPKYRGYSITLLKEVMKIKDVFFISHSTINKILKIYFYHKWKVFDEHFYYIFGSFKFYKKFNFIKLNNDKSEFLDTENKKIYEDHKNYNCSFYKAVINDEEILIIGKVKKFKKILNYFEIIYVSNLELFNSYCYVFVNNLKKETKSFFIRIDSRFINNCKKVFKLKIKLKNHKKIYYYSKEINQKEKNFFNNLYSEIFLLDI